MLQGSGEVDRKIGRSRDSDLIIHRLSSFARREAQVPSVLTASDDIKLAKSLLFITIQCTFFSRESEECVCVYVCVCVYARVRAYVCMRARACECVCVRERERERE